MPYFANNYNNLHLSATLVDDKLFNMVRTYSQYAVLILPLPLSSPYQENSIGFLLESLSKCVCVQVCVWFCNITYEQYKPVVLFGQTLKSTLWCEGKLETCPIWAIIAAIYDLRILRLACSVSALSQSSTHRCLFVTGFKHVRIIKIIILIFRQLT